MIYPRRPEGWENRYSEEHYREYLPFAKSGQKPYDILWTMEDCEIAFETGADAMLEALKKEGYPIRGKGDMYYHGIDASGTLVFIPDEVKK